MSCQPILADSGQGVAFQREGHQTEGRVETWGWKGGGGGGGGVKFLKILTNQAVSLYQTSC